MSPSWAKIGLQVPLSDDNTGCLSITDTQLESHKIKNHHRGFLTVETDISLWATQDLQTNHLVATVLCDLAAPGKRHAETGPGPTLSPTALRVVPGALILAQGPPHLLCIVPIVVYALPKRAHPWSPQNHRDWKATTQASQRTPTGW